MKRWISLVATLLVLSLVAVACGGGATPAPSSTDTPVPQVEAEPTETEAPATPTEAPPTEGPPTPTEKAEEEEPTTTDEVDRTIEVTAKSLEFDPVPIEIKKGETVQFVIRSEDIYHTFSVRKSKEAQEDLFSLDLYPDQPAAEKVFTAQETGTLYLYCKPHEGVGMTGTIEVAP